MMLLRQLALLSFLFGFASCASDGTGDPNRAFTQPYGGAPQAIPGKIEAEHYDEGPPEIAYHDVDEKNHGADYRGVTHVDIEKRSDASNGYGVGWTRAGEWLVYTVDVKESATYKVEFPVASNKKGGRFHLEVDGKDVSGPIDVPDTGSWQTLEMIAADGVHLEAGVHAMKMVMDSEGESGSIADIDYMMFTRAD